MSLRRVNFELEAKLCAETGGLFSSPAGKIERKSYGDGGERLKITLRKVRGPDGTMARVRVNGREIAQISLVRGTGRLDRELGAEGAVPEMAAGQRVDVEIDGATILSGVLFVD